MRPALAFSLLALACVAFHLARPARHVSTGGLVLYGATFVQHWADTRRKDWPVVEMPDVGFTYADTSKQLSMPKAKP